MKYRDLPHTDTSKNPNLKNKLINAKQVNQSNILAALIKKINNYLLSEIAFVCPLNSIRVWCHRKRGANIGKNVFIGLHVVLDRVHPELVTLEDECGLAGGNHILTHTRPPKHSEGFLNAYAAEVVISKGAWLGINSIVLPGLKIGVESIVSAGSVVTGSIPDHCIARGNPARVLYKTK